MPTPPRPDGDESVATLERPKAAPALPRADRLRPWRVLLHNDEVNYDLDVVNAIVEVARLPRLDARQRMLEAHRRGIALLLVTHREHAELLQEKFTSKRLTVTIEPE
jgi:ATP-dependent Clp protease adapter protein ClpS